MNARVDDHDPPRPLPDDSGLDDVRFGLAARFGVLLGGLLCGVIAIAGLLWHLHDRRVDELLQESSAATHALAAAELERRGRQQALHLAGLLAEPLAQSDLAAVAQRVRSVGMQPDVAYVRVYDRQGRVVHGSAGAGSGASGDVVALGFPESGDPAIAWLPDGMLASGAIVLRGERLGGLQLGYGLDGEHGLAGQQALGERLQTLGRRQLAIEAGLLGLATTVALLLWLLAGRAFVRPLRRLIDVARDVEAGRFETAATSTLQHRDARRRDELGALVRAFGRMSRSVARHDRDIRNLAFSDALTGLPNRYAFRELLDQSVRVQQLVGGELAVLFVDLDDFKRINDTLGHDVGDKVLEQFAARIDACVREVGGRDAQLARFAGDEFIALIAGPGGVRRQAAHLAECILEAVQSSVDAGRSRVCLGASIGIAVYPHDAANTILLLKGGDVAMYQAKVAGKNCYRFYSRSMDEAVERHMQMEQDLHEAWERGELHLEYQPVFRLADGRLLGAEALLRWNHPRHGPVSPSVFIGVAEQSGLIQELGRRVIQRACADAAGWAAAGQGPAPFVAVNVSARQLQTGDLLEVIQAGLDASGLPPGRLHVELTETAILSNALQAGALLARLRSMDVQIWLDDFGTGFSGLNHLRRVPVDGLKIDRSFVADVLDDPDDLALTSGIIDMAHSLGIVVVAEGVERAEQYELLRARGCDLAQGYLLGRPMSSEALRARLREGRARGGPA